MLKKKYHVFYEEDDDDPTNNIALTKAEVAYLVGTASSTRKASDRRPSTQTNLAKKLRRFTGWNMNFIQLACKFSYKYGLLKL
jgi:hypothetical protein